MSECNLLCVKGPHKDLYKSKCCWDKWLREDLSIENVSQNDVILFILLYFNISIKIKSQQLDELKATVHNI